MQSVSLSVNCHRPFSRFSTSQIIPLARGVHSPNRMIHISPIYIKIINSPYFHKIYTFPPTYAKFTFFGLVYVFCFPHFDHDAFMHHTLHGLDAPASGSLVLQARTLSLSESNQLLYIISIHHLLYKMKSYRHRNKTSTKKCML